MKVGVFELRYIYPEAFGISGYHGGSTNILVDIRGERRLVRILRCLKYEAEPRAQRLMEQSPPLIFDGSSKKSLKIRFIVTLNAGQSTENQLEDSRCRGRVPLN